MVQKYLCKVEKDPSASGRECNEQANKMSGLQGGIKVMAMPYKKDRDNALCSPASALRKDMNAE